jgi:regulator of protease activity HflC (stomatin/prohibitin superfamily)
MIKKLLMVVALAAVIISLSTGCTRVEPGWAGIKVNQAGSNKGVEDYPIQTGWVWYMPVLTRVYEYPMFQQNVIWCASAHEGAATDESISFNCKGGAAITADVAMSGKFKNDKIPYVFVKFRSEPNLILHGYLRNEVRDCLGRIGATYDPMDIIGDKRSIFLNEVKKELDLRVGPWWETDFITFANKLRMDEKIEKSINSIIEQKQQTQQSELKVQQKKAEADQAVAEADGLQRSKVAMAEGEAKATLTKAEAQAKANKLLSESLTPGLVAWEGVTKWNGTMPLVTGGGALPFINISTNK